MCSGKYTFYPGSQQLCSPLYPQFTGRKKPAGDTTDTEPSAAPDNERKLNKKKKQQKKKLNKKKKKKQSKEEDRILMTTEHSLTEYYGSDSLGCGLE